ncbi:MAG: twin-arginine translocase TatA/TatE family subunit [Deltaproteobacteria bacterium]|nr:twin-arginine translocase TatA/TatE family subunit [Deltaproteobacteria bacterium]MBW2083319.1 twin-arginine translocase TatA/TatE family subunit [Deltaproteobacteria bacterium]HDM10377.1 twin-arginine translocase TatA/TatE family subunit [Desulfobacteraceae bacterium]
MFGLGPTELFIIALIILLIFGAKRLPEIGKGLGGAIREFKKVKKELSSDKQEEQESTSTSETVNKDNTANKIEQKMKDKVLEQVPGVKKVIDAKKKVDKVKDIVK